MSPKRKTAGELSLKAASDTVRYDPLEVAHALTDKMHVGLEECIKNHLPIIAEDEFFIVVILAGDPLLHNALRVKYCALLHLPKPRPQQAVFLYNRHTQRIKFLWSLPDAENMALIDEALFVDKVWQRTKRWVRSYYDGTFHEDIRKEHNINHLSEKEFLDLHHDELIKAGLKNPPPGFTDPFDFSKISSPAKPFRKIEDSDEALAN